MNYTLRGGENSTKGGRGLGDIVISPPNTLMNTLATNSIASGDYNPDLNNFGQDQINALNGTAGGPDFTGTTDTLTNLVNSFTGSVSGSNGPSITTAVMLIGVTVLGVLLLEGRR